MVEADSRVHGTTGEKPIDRFERVERQALRPLPDRPLVVRYVRLRRRVAHDALIDIDTVRYSVPHRLVREAVEVDLGEKLVRIFFDGNIVATHHRSFERNARIVDPEHFRGLLRLPSTELVSKPVTSPLAELGRSLAQYAEVVQ